MDSINSPLVQRKNRWIPWAVTLVLLQLARSPTSKRLNQSLNPEPCSSQPKPITRDNPCNHMAFPFQYCVSIYFPKLGSSSILFIILLSLIDVFLSHLIVFLLQHCFSWLHCNLLSGYKLTLGSGCQITFRI
jgi:hypothetical protein